MSKSSLKILLRIANALGAFFPIGPFTFFAVAGVIGFLKTGEFLNNPFLFLWILGGISGFVGMIFCAFNKYNYFTLALLSHGVISLVIFGQGRLLVFEFFPILIDLTLALYIPNGLICLKNKKQLV